MPGRPAKGVGRGKAIPAHTLYPPQPLGTSQAGHHLDKVRYGQGGVEERGRRIAVVQHWITRCPGGGCSGYRARGADVSDHALMVGETRLPAGCVSFNYPVVLSDAHFLIPKRIRWW